MSRIPKVGFLSSIPKENGHQENKPTVRKNISGSNLRNAKRPSEENQQITMVNKKPKVEPVSLKNKVVSTFRHPDSISKSAMAEKSKRAVLQPIPDSNLVRSSMPAQVSTTKVKIPGKPKRPAWDLKGRIQDMEEYFTTTNASLKQELEANKQRLEALESEKNLLHKDVEVKSVQSEEAISKLTRLEKELRLKTEECETLTREKDQEIQRLRKEVNSLSFELGTLKVEYENLKNLYQQETASLKSTVTSLTCLKSGIETELSANKLMVESQQKEITEKNTELEYLRQQVSTMESKLREEETIRRKLHNTVQELKGNIRVFCRMRPPLPEEIKSGMNVANIVAVSDKTIEIQQLLDVGLNESGGKMQPKYEFSFDCYFPPSTAQEKIFDEISQLVQSSLDGYNVCIFAYGQTGSGKTYTMEGPASIVDFVADKNDPNLGMIPRSVEQIFTTIANLEPKGWKYKVEALFLEIYNERIRDLLNSQINTKCEIVKSGNKGTDCIISNVTTSEVTSSIQVYELMKKARINRAVAATKCNEYSSRSHYVFQMKIFGENSITGEKCDGTLNLVDLAGSERVKESESAGDRLTEAKAINKSLSNLGKVIMSLSKKENHIPYRDSKLTHLLANSLGGNSKTLMFVNISPDNKNLTETINSLRFATKVNQCNIGTAQKRVK